MRSFGSVLDNNRGVGPGFDTLRITLSVLILCFHAQPICTGSSEIWKSPIRFAAALLIPAFFAVSGFLVMGSALRIPSLIMFLIHRILRIVPALLTEVFITALVLGSLITKIEVVSYLTSSGFLSYFKNIFGHVQFTLPGVFADNPHSTVNGSLWTIQPEIFCYVFLALAILASLHRNKVVYTTIAGMLFVAVVAMDAVHGIGPGDVGVVAQARAFLFFVVGSVAYLFRFRIPFSPVLAGLAVLISIPLLQTPGLAVFASIPVVYCVIYMGLSRLPTSTLLSRGDYSYGIYLYAYPIQQLIVMLSPDGYRVWYVNILLALPITISIAALSWHFIERPCLSLRRIVIIDEKKYLGGYLSRCCLAGILYAYALFLWNWSGVLYLVGISLKSNIIPIALMGLATSLLVAVGFRYPSIQHSNFCRLRTLRNRLTRTSAPTSR
jgi:peptidoglycan/LPS O-acetylase OafA/YrhL